MPRDDKPADSEPARPLSRAGKPTLKTIAEMTGLAITTVSRALGNDPQISEATRRRVHAMAAEVGYLPDRAAQRLKTGRTNVISVLLDPHEEILGFGTSVMHGLARALQGTPYHLIVTPTFPEDGKLDAVNYIIRNGMADGLIFSRTEPFDPRVRLLIENGFPFVTHGRTEFSTPHAFVDYDNVAFAHAAVRRLIAKGRRKVTIILPPKRLTFHQHMLHGFMTAVREAGVAYEIPEGLDLDCPADAIRDHVCRRSTEPDPPDGFACPGEVSALATITGMSDNGLTLGAEYDIVAKQTSRLLSQIQPKVETIYEDLTAAGEAMGRLLLRRIAAEPAEGLYLLQAPQIGFVAG